MANKITQSQRIAAEAAHTPSSDVVSGRAVAIVDRYRLQPDDLPGGRVAGRIHGVSTQGVEALTSLAYIEGVTKPLALSGEDVERLVRMTGSPFASDWIGCKVEVRVVRSDGRREVRLFAPGMAGPPVDTPARPKGKRRRSLWTALAFLVIVLAALLLVYGVEQGPALWSLVEQSISSFGR